MYLYWIYQYINFKISLTFTIGVECLQMFHLIPTLEGIFYVQNGIFRLNYGWIQKLFPFLQICVLHLPLMFEEWLQCLGDNSDAGYLRPVPIVCIFMFQFSCTSILSFPLFFHLTIYSKISWGIILICTSCYSVYI